MRSTDATQLRGASITSVTQRWRGLLWKVILAGLLLLLFVVGIPSPGQLFPFLVQPTLLLWGTLFVWLAGSSFFAEMPALRWAWCALSVGAYAALSIPAMLTLDSARVYEPTRIIDALGPVAALTLAAHLGRHDLQRALRDWAVVMGLALYSGLGVGAMWLVLATFGPAVFTIAVLLPPLVLEVVLLLVRRLSGLGEGWRYALALLPSTALAVGIISTTQFNPTMSFSTSLIFDAIIAVLIGGALLVSLLTRPMTEAASGGVGVARSLIEFTHGAMLIALAVYVPLRLFSS